VGVWVGGLAGVIAGTVVWDDLPLVSTAGKIGRIVLAYLLAVSTVVSLAVTTAVLQPCGLPTAM
jgi:hypothetical protein